MHMDPIMPVLTATVLAILIIGLIMNRLKQPYVVGYLIAGVLIGPSGINLVGDQIDISRIGAIGVLLLLFFIGMEISLPRLIENWRIAVIGTLLQVAITTACVFGIGYWLDWPLARSILMGFVISLSSTAVIIKILQEWGEVDSEVGRDVIGIILMQDLAVVPMMITVNFMGGSSLNPIEIVLQIIGGLAIIALLVWMIVKQEITLPFGNLLRKNHELQVFSAFILCLGLALATGLLNLSAALGAFIAGILISSAKETSWVHQRLEPFYVVFVALFFVSIGMLVDIGFIRTHLVLIISLVALALISNTLINGFVMRALGADWRQSWYGGALLSQIGEFSFVLAAIGLQASIVSQFGYQLIIAVISLTLLVSPLWILSVKRLTRG